VVSALSVLTGAILVTGAAGEVLGSLTSDVPLVDGQSAGPSSPEIVDASDGQDVPPGANWLRCTDLDEPLNFAEYSLGEEFQGLRLAFVMRRCMTPVESPKTIRENYVDYIYGECEPEPTPGEQLADGGCSPPLEIQSWPACERSLADYQAAPGIPYPHEQIETLKGGAVKATFDGGGRIEIYTARSTVVIFGNDPELVDRAAAVLRLDRAQSNVGVPSPSETAAAELPPPSLGSMSGELQCTS
jgi:hypothetical protein